MLIAAPCWTNGDPGTCGNLEGELGSDDPLMAVAEEDPKKEFKIEIQTRDSYLSLLLLLGSHLKEGWRPS